MTIGPHASASEREEFRRRVVDKPRSYIAQPTIGLGTHPTLVDGKLEARCVDLRPYVLFRDCVRVIPGGLTRVALRRGSLVVNSSQGGGYKDTWVLAPDGDGASERPGNGPGSAARRAQETYEKQVSLLTSRDWPREIGPREIEFLEEARRLDAAAIEQIGKALNGQSN